MSAHARLCAHCGAALARREGERADSFRSRKTCGRECADLMHRAPAIQKRCLNCGVTFDSGPVGKRSSPSEFSRQKYCGHECAKSSKRAAQRNCGHCGARFSSRHRATIFCGRACAYVARTTGTLRRIGAPESKTCCRCGAPFGRMANESTYNYLKRKLCNRKCGAKADVYGVMMTIEDVSMMTGLSGHTIGDRLRRDIPLLTPPRPGRRLGNP